MKYGRAKSFDCQIRKVSETDYKKKGGYDWLLFLRVFSGTVEYKFICDTMLEGLTTALINCGVDAVYMAGGGPSSTDHCINVGRQENRIVLTQATVHRQVVFMCYQMQK